MIKQKGGINMRVKVFRYSGENFQSSNFQEYDVPVPKDINWTIMDVLDYISLNLDSSLSYYKHSVCNHGICGRCLLKVNGIPKLACTCIANEYEELILEPKNNTTIIKDLICR